MTRYRIALTLGARKDVAKLQKDEPSAFKKLEMLLKELEYHPYEGTGKPKPLGGDRVGQWSRRITGKHRLVYMVEDEALLVLVIASRNHYGDK